MPLAQLLGLAQAAPGAVAGPLDEIEETEDEIVVDANRMDPYALENPQAITQRDMAAQQARETSDHRGMFGTRGTLRDVLGVVGDASLVQSGNKPMYAPVRQQERISDAMAGFTENPMAAIERVAGEHPELARQMYEQYQMNQYRTNTNTTAASRADTAAADLSRKSLTQAREEASQAIAGALAVGTPEALQYAQSIAIQSAEAYGFTPKELGLPEGVLTADQARVLAGRSATTNQNLRLPQYERGLDQGQQRIEETRRTNRVREAQAGKNEKGRMTRAEMTDERIRGGQRDGTKRSLRQGPESSPSANRPRSNW